MPSPLRVLCLDIEGGHGGSSRSLFQALKHMDREAAAVEVWCRRPGPVQEWYAALGIPCRVEPDMPKVTAVPRLSRNLYMQAVHLRDAFRSRGFRARLAAASAAVSAVHLNHESLAGLAAWLRPHTRAAIVVHNRTMLPDNWFARRQVRLMQAGADRLVFITANEEANVRRLGCGTPGEVIHNAAEIPDRMPEPFPGIPLDGRLRVACLSNYSWGRGLDRLVDVAQELRQLGREDVLFVLAGDMGLTAALPGELGRIGARGGSLADYAQARGVAGYFRFLGHVSEPERVLAACAALAKPTREHNPWGRDILEALALGRPVLTVGSCATFVRNGETGVLQPEFSARGMAEALAGLADAPDRIGEMGRRAVAVIRDLCSGPDRAADLVRAWRAAAESRSGRP